MAGKKYVLNESAARKLQQMLRRGPSAPFTQLTFREAVTPTTNVPALMFQAPSGGIGARAAGSNVAVGATCKPVEFNEQNGQYVVDPDPANEVTVYNWTRSVVCSKGLRYGWALRRGNQWHVIADDCKDA